MIDYKGQANVPKYKVTRAYRKGSDVVMILWLLGQSMSFAPFCVFSSGLFCYLNLLLCSYFQTDLVEVGSRTLLLVIECSSSDLLTTVKFHSYFGNIISFILNQRHDIFSLIPFSRIKALLQNSSASVSTSSTASLGFFNVTSSSTISFLNANKTNITTINMAKQISEAKLTLDQCDWQFFPLCMTCGRP